jgi:hypothetical protein
MIDFLARPLGKVAIVVFAIVSLLGLRAWDVYHQQSIGAAKERQEIVQRSEQQGAANAAQAEKAHTTARKPGAADRLRKDPATCPDCR